jgi:hypothetical protein
MGVQGFTKVFPPKREIKYPDMNGKRIIIDASSELYRAALSMSASSNLTDNKGNPTSHINTILLGVIIKLKGAGAIQYWVFDYDQKRKSGEAFHVQMKEFELMKRNDKKQKSKEKLRKLNEEKKKLEARAKLLDDQKSDTELFSSDEDEPDASEELIKLEKPSKLDEALCVKKELQCCTSEIDKHEKRAFRLKRFYIDDVIVMLNMLDIPWLMCPPGFEAEQICAMATRTDKIAGVKMDYVLTPDADAIAFGASAIIKRDIRNKKFFEYRTQELLDEYNLSQDDIIKISLILGCDYAKKTPRVGIKTVLSKYQIVELTPEQKDAECIFKRVMTDEEIKTIDVINAGETSFTSAEKYVELLDWLQLSKCYDRHRIDTQFKKNRLFLQVRENNVRSNTVLDGIDKATKPIRTPTKISKKIGKKIEKK